MTARDFCYWLQGFFELQAAGTEGVKLDLGIPSAKAEVIRRHLALVFAHDIDPKAGPKEVQDELNAIHHGAKKTHTGEVLMRC